MNTTLEEQITENALETKFSGVVSFQSEELSFEKAFGFRDRANELPNTIDTRFGIASGTKGFTALGIATLISHGKLSMDTTARSVMEDRIRNLNPAITIKQLLAHTSGIGDYYDEDEIGDGVNEMILSIPVQNLVSPFDYIPLLEEKNQKFAPGTKANYSNGGYVLLSILIEEISKTPFHQFVDEQVFKKFEMKRSGFFKSDALPGNTALGYVSKNDPLRTNIFNLPIIGSGDGGAYSSAEDMHRFWRNLKSREVLPKQTLDPFLKTQNIIGGNGYGYGFWIDDKLDRIVLAGHDAGVSFDSSTSRFNDHTFTIISNTSEGAWPLSRLIKTHLSVDS